MVCKEFLDFAIKRYDAVLFKDEKTGEEFAGARVSLKVVDSDDGEQIKTANYKNNDESI